MSNDVERIIAYLRVSTDEQGRSGLGLEAQRHAIETYCEQTGATLLRVYQEIESGGTSDRPELSKAIAHANRSQAVLVASTLDRLGREVHFIAGLRKRGVRFRCADAPHDDETMIYMRAIFAERELKKIRQRTKDALAVLKAKGTKLGGRRPNAHKLTDEERRRGAVAGGQAARSKAIDAYADIAPVMVEWRADGVSQTAIAHRLNEEGHTTRQGKQWTQAQVSRVLRRYMVTLDL